MNSHTTEPAADDDRVGRRDFLRHAAAVGIGFAGLRTLVHGAQAVAYPTGPPLDDPLARHRWAGYGPPVPDPRGLLDVPAGFVGRPISRWGERMDDGFAVPALHDGMAAFAAPDGLTVLVRNHEVDSSLPRRFGPFGARNELLERIDPVRLYDAGHGAGFGRVLGGTTTIVYDTARQRVARHFLSLAGTIRNCAGGPTPWGTWLTCEEDVQVADERHLRSHGWVFEVPASMEPVLVDPVPLTGLGRFMHEAVAVDPRTGIVYQTEDRGDGCIYRFVPNRPARRFAELRRGGRLQALAVRAAPSLDTRNWRTRTVEVGTRLPVRWLDIDGIDSPHDDLRHRAVARGAARFARGEGMWHGNDAVYFACTNGGPPRHGQIWRYVPSPSEGTDDEWREPGTLELFVEPPDASLVRNADNLTVAPDGTLFVCEDGDGRDRVILVDRHGRCATFAHSRLDEDELAGACFSPDGSTLFVNLQHIGITMAITGPWPWSST